MTRVETIGDCTLYHGDCREIVGGLSGVDAVVTDPPYGIGYQHSGGGAPPPGATSCRRNARMPIHQDDEPFDPATLLGFPSVLMFGADHYRQRLPEGGTFIAWDKSCGKGPNDSFADAEFAWTNHKVKRNVIRYLWKGIACEKAGEENGRRYHPTQKPLGLMRRCLAFFPSAETIADPFMGSGSTGVACVQTGRKFIGIEIDPTHFETAVRRIRRAVQDQRSQLPLEAAC